MRKPQDDVDQQLPRVYHVILNEAPKARSEESSCKDYLPVGSTCRRLIASARSFGLLRKPQDDEGEIIVAARSFTRFARSG